MEVSKISASSLQRFMTCNGFLTLDLPRQEQSEAAAEGEAFHDLLECYVKALPIADVAKNGKRFDTDMHFYAKVYAPQIPTTSDSELKCDFQVNDKIKISGRYDYVWEEDGGDTLVVADIKYGYMPVDVKDNWQLIAYAIGELIKRQKSYNKITLRIIQPRAHHEDGPVRDCNLTTEQLYEFFKVIKHTVDQFSEGKIHFTTSSNCKYCAAAATKCAALTKAFYNSVDVVLNKQVSDDLSNDEISSMLYLYDRIKDLFKIKMDSIQELAKSKIKSGEILQGYDLKESFGNRTWNENFNPDNILMLTGIDLSEKVLISPAKAEKILDKKVIQNFTKREFKGFNLVATDHSKLANNIFNKGE